MTTFNPDTFDARIVAWETANELVNPIVSNHGLEAYKSGPPFHLPHTTTLVDQHVDQIIRVADWLLEQS